MKLGKYIVILKNRISEKVWQSREYETTRFSFNVTLISQKNEGNNTPKFLTWESKGSERIQKVKYAPTVTANFLDTNEATNITLGKLRMVKMMD